MNIVLVEPQIPQNTGNIARTCGATGASLHLVQPMGFTVTDKHLKRAGLDYWHLLDITYYDGIDDFLARTQGNYFFFTTKTDKVFTKRQYDGEVFLVFGREDKGLPEPFLQMNKENCCTIPMRNEARSLNLSNSVAIAVYEVLRQWDFPME